ncbi:hypothetical protein V8E55_000277 [Tylopilus felleus]
MNPHFRLDSHVGIPPQQMESANVASTAWQPIKCKQQCLSPNQNQTAEILSGLRHNAAFQSDKICLACLRNVQRDSKVLQDGCSTYPFLSSPLRLPIYPFAPALNFTVYETPELSSSTPPKVPSLQDSSSPAVVQCHEHDGADSRLVLTEKKSYFTTKELAEEADFEADMLLAHINAIPVSYSLPAIPEDDCTTVLRTVVAQMIGRDSAQIRLGFVHLVIDFALILRTRLRERGSAVRNEVAITGATTGM